MSQLHVIPLHFLMPTRQNLLQKFFKNKNISKKLKLRLKNTIIDKTLTYVSETSKRDRKQLNIFERKEF
jgi:hypothetical protein